MKSFIVGLIGAVVLAVASGFVLEGYFSQEAEDQFKTSYARVGPGSTFEERQFSGPGQER
ncbi:MAG TPA: hypothetical protein VF606_02375 [Geminicoccaceae bacterium]